VGVSALTLDLLSWVDGRTRSYDETLEAWRTNCPRLSIWDDAVIDGLVRIDRRPGQGASVVLTALGRAALTSQDVLIESLHDRSRPS
jgi:hypothetical protein